MNENNEENLMNAVMHSTLKKVQKVSKNTPARQDKSCFEYELLKAALTRKDLAIINFLFKYVKDKLKIPEEPGAEEILLSLAVKLDNANIIKKMQKIGVSICDKYHDGESILFTAFKHGHFRAVDILLKSLNYDNVDPKNANDILHFHIATIRNDCENVDNFLKKGFNVNSLLSLDSVEYSGLNPLHYAVMKKNFDMLQELLSYDADLSIKNNDAQTPLHILFYSDFLDNGKYNLLNAFNLGKETKYINCVDSNGISHFHLSCFINSSHHMQRFIDTRVDINSAISVTSPVYPGFTALHIAVENNFTELVKLLLKHGADCNKVDTKGRTPLHLACQLCEDVSIIRILVENKASIIAVDEKGCTPLHTAFYHWTCEKSKIFDILMSDTRSEVNVVDNQGLSYFHIACANNYISHVNGFLSSNVNINEPVSSGKYGGYTALHFAALYNCKKIVKMLLKRNAQVNSRTSELQSTPLHFASEFNHIKLNEYYIEGDGWSGIPDCLIVDECWKDNEKNQFDIIKLLLLHKAEVNAKDSLGKTPLLHACTIRDCGKGGDWGCAYKHILINKIGNRLNQIFEILLSHGANVNARAQDLSSVLDIISINEGMESLENTIEFLITKGANVHAADNAGLTPLHMAVKRGNQYLVQILLKHNVDVNTKSQKSKIPVQLLSLTYETRGILLALLDNGSEVNVKYENGKTLLQHTLEHPDVYILEKLLSYGADLNIEDLSEKLAYCTFERNKMSNISSLVYDARFNSPRSEYGNFLRTIYHHVQKLLALGINLSEKAQSCYDTLCQRIFLTLPYRCEIYNKCVEELKRMKDIELDKNVSLYSILVKDPDYISKYVRQCSFIQYMEKVDDRFPLYSYLLKYQCKKGLRRYELMQYSKELLDSISKTNLPDLCCDSLTKYLTNEDLANLEEAVMPGVKGLKRKMNYNSTETEPPTKLRLKK